MSGKTQTTMDKKPAAEHGYDASKGIVYEELKKTKYAVDRNIDELPFLERVNWLSTTIIFAPMIFAFVGMAFVTPHWKTLVFAAVWYFLCACGITMGYHRMWSHRAYRSAPVIEFLLACFGAAAFQGSARWWSRNHRVHHRYVDTEKDPYAVHRGFWFAHLGWMVFKQDARRFGRVDISDLNANPILCFQHRNYLTIAITVAAIIPLAVCTLFWGDFWGGLVYGVFLRITALHHATFCINSVAHYWGEQPFSAGQSAKDSIICALLTNGEGYHNFHHEYPHDYRNAVKWYQYDPTKWAIAALSWFGLTYDLNAVTDNEIMKARSQAAALNVDWGCQHPEQLPEKWDKTKLEREAKEKGRMVLGIYNRVIELPAPFVENHPGGASILRFWAGKDSTNAFNGDVYNHAKGARNLLAHYTIAHFVDGTPETYRGDGRDPIAMNIPTTEERKAAWERCIEERNEKEAAILRMRFNSDCTKQEEKKAQKNVEAAPIA